MAQRALSKAAREEFAKLVDEVSLPSGRINNGRRVIARLRMNKFVEEHGKEACDAAFEEIK